MAAVAVTPISLTPGVLAEAVVDLGAIAHNVRVLCEHAGGAQVMAVVKADGYGHGATQVARTALAAAVLASSCRARARSAESPSRTTTRSTEMFVALSGIV